MIARPDLLSGDSPEGLEVYQLTSEAVSSCHVYMEAQVFAPDSSCFLLHRSARPHGSDSDDPLHRYLLCDVATGELLPVTSETGATSPSVSPDGKWFYYFVTLGGQYSTALNERVVLRRRNLDGTEPVDLLVIDDRIPGTPFHPSRLYPLSTISSDGKRLATACFLGDGAREGAPWGLWVIDLESGESWLPVIGPTWSNLHPQYCRSLDPEFCRDIMIQENHGAIRSADGGRKGCAPASRGADVHLVRDDGQHFRSFPWGRRRDEQAQGHQCWRGKSQWAIISTNTLREDPERHEGWLLESEALPFTDHLGAELGGVRNRLCAGMEGKHFSHFASDADGARLVTDCLENPDEFLKHEGAVPRDALYLLSLGEAGEEPARKLQFLLRPRTSWHNGAHAHPFLSPDGRAAFFNSDESGTMQAYMVKNLPQPTPIES